MGWTSYHATRYDENGKVDRKAECDYCVNRVEHLQVLKSRMVGTVYYAAVLDSRTNDVFAAVFLTSGADRHDPYFNFGYKDMPETVGPSERKCPKAILDMLTPTDHEWAKEWRADCYRNLAAKKANSWFKDLPVGSKIKTTIWGTEYELIKHAPAYGYRTWFWYVPKNHTSMPKKYVQAENSVVLN